MKQQSKIGAKHSSGLAEPVAKAGVREVKKKINSYSMATKNSDINEQSVRILAQVVYKNQEQPLKHLSNLTMQAAKAQKMHKR